jgi:predicted ATPase
VNAPSDVLTFLFTDIEGSTRRWEADAEGMRAALETHNQTLRDAVKAHGGQVFNYTGDGMCAVFMAPRPAVDAAVAAQQALELPVRMGIATGEAELRGDDYFGTVLNRTARVMAAGHGGQILLDGATAGLLTGVEPAELGTRRLRDIAKPVELFQVRAGGLRIDFPPLKTDDGAPGNLRPRTTSFVGREVEVDDVQAALKSHRLVTLTGVGGVGKTRLALEVASRVGSDFPDGVWVIELAAVGDPNAVPEAVAATLGITQQPGLSITDSIAGALEGRTRLLLLDNCEHVLNASADIIDAVLGQSATVKVIATSREGLRLNDEQIWPVPSLDFHSGADSAAATLLVDRAQTVAPDASMTAPGEADALAEICRRLDGIPLAIELAASRMVSMTAMELRDRLDDRFRLLVGSRRGLERHQTLRHAVQWSYDLLSDSEKTLLTMCSVFAGGFDLAAASVIGGSADELATLDLLDALVRKSLVVADRSSSRTRFTILETIRQFAEEQLVDSGEADMVRNAHARYFAEREPDVMALWDSPRQREAYAWLALELANLRAAFRWSADTGDLDTALGIAICAAMLGSLHEQFEPIGWAEELVESAKAVAHPRLAHLYVMAAGTFVTGRINDGIRYSDAAREAIDSGRFDEVPYGWAASIGGSYITSGQPERWVSVCDEFIAHEGGTRLYSRASLVVALVVAGDYDAARVAADGLQVAADATDNPHMRSWALLACGMACRDTDPKSAYQLFRRAMQVAQDSGTRQTGSFIAVSLAMLAVLHGEPGNAFDYVTLAIRNFYDSGNLSILRTPLAILAILLDRLGFLEPAATIGEFGATPLSRAAYPEIDGVLAHLREVLGDETYAALAQNGTNMTNAGMVAYAFEQIDLVRAHLVHVDESP